MNVREVIQVAIARVGVCLGNHDTEMRRSMEHAFRQGDDLELGRLVRRAIERELREATWK